MIIAFLTHHRNVYPVLKLCIDQCHDVKAYFRGAHIANTGSIAARTCAPRQVEKTNLQLFVLRPNRLHLFYDPHLTIPAERLRSIIVVSLTQIFACAKDHPGRHAYSANTRTPKQEFLTRGYDTSIALIAESANREGALCSHKRFELAVTQLPNPAPYLYNLALLITA